MNIQVNNSFKHMKHQFVVSSHSKQELRFTAILAKDHEHESQTAIESKDQTTRNKSTPILFHLNVMTFS